MIRFEQRFMSGYIQCCATEQQRNIRIPWNIRFIVPIYNPPPVIFILKIPKIPNKKSMAKTRGRVMTLRKVVHSGIRFGSNWCRYSHLSPVSTRENAGHTCGCPGCGWKRGRACKRCNMDFSCKPTTKKWGQLLQVSKSSKDSLTKINGCESKLARPEWLIGRQNMVPQSWYPESLLTWALSHLATICGKYWKIPLTPPFIHKPLK